MQESNTSECPSKADNNDNTTSNKTIQYLTSTDKVQECNKSECPSKIKVLPVQGLVMITDQEEVLKAKVIAQALEVISRCEEIPLQKRDVSLHSTEQIATKVNEILVIIESHILFIISITMFQLVLEAISTCEKIPLPKRDASLHSTEEVATKLNDFLVIIDSYFLFIISIAMFRFFFSY